MARTINSLRCNATQGARIVPTDGQLGQIYNKPYWNFYFHSFSVVCSTTKWLIVKFSVMCVSRLKIKTKTKVWRLVNMFSYFYLKKNRERAIFVILLASLFVFKWSSRNGPIEPIYTLISSDHSNLWGLIFFLQKWQVEYNHPKNEPYATGGESTSLLCKFKIRGCLISISFCFNDKLTLALLFGVKSDTNLSFIRVKKKSDLLEKACRTTDLSVML